MIMLDITLANWIAILAFLPIIVGIFELLNWKYMQFFRMGILVAIGVFSLVADFKKNKLDVADSTASTLKMDSIIKQNRDLKNDNANLSRKLDSNAIYLKRLDSAGVKNVNNFPNFKEFRDHSTNVESHNQRGGQTGRDFNNTYH